MIEVFDLRFYISGGETKDDLFWSFWQLKMSNTEPLFYLGWVQLLPSGGLSDEGLEPNLISHVLQLAGFLLALYTSYLFEMFLIRVEICSSVVILYPSGTGPICWSAASDSDENHGEEAVWQIKWKSQEGNSGGFVQHFNLF